MEQLRSCNPIYTQMHTLHEAHQRWWNSEPYNPITGASASDYDYDEATNKMNDVFREGLKQRCFKPFQDKDQKNSQRASSSEQKFAGLSKDSFQKIYDSFAIHYEYSVFGIGRPVTVSDYPLEGKEGEKLVQSYEEYCKLTNKHPKKLEWVAEKIYKKNGENSDSSPK